MLIPQGLWAWPSPGDAMNYWGEIFGATGDFVQNYKDMRQANWIGTDKYFHCKANLKQRSAAGLPVKTQPVLSVIRGNGETRTLKVILLQTVRPTKLPINMVVDRVG